MPEIVNTSRLGSFEAEAIGDESREVMIDVNHVSMSFNMASEAMTNLKEYAIALVRGKLFFEEFVALDDVSFKVRKGDVYGIMGTNGSGKSTLLKIIAGVLDPTKGSCTLNGNIAPLIELGAGFDMELSARENIYLNGALLGYSKEFIDQHFDEIVEFAEVEKFLDMPIKNYSSGMVSRIAFAIATVIVPEILLVDEVLSVGDFMFQKKCERRITELIEQHGVTVLIVSHSNEQVARLCNKAVWIEKGHVRTIGPADEVSRIYGLLGGRTGSAESEEVVYQAMLRESESELSSAFGLVDCGSIAQASIDLARRGWPENPQTVVLADASTHIPAVLCAPLAHKLDAPVIAWDFHAPSPEALYYLQSVQPSKIFAVRCSLTASSEMPLDKRFDWSPDITLLQNATVGDLAAALFDEGVKMGAWSGKGAVTVAFEDSVLSMAASARAAQMGMPVFCGLDSSQTTAGQMAERLLAQGIANMYVVGPSVPEWQVKPYEEADVSLSYIARDGSVSAYTETFEALGGKYESVTQVLVDAESPGTWINLLGAPAYIAHVQGLMVIQNQVDLDSTVGVIRAIQASKNATSVVCMRSSGGLTSNDASLLASCLTAGTE